ncbi:MAG: hypothetical protein Q8R44_19515 [Novosphingobium sp.]|nr:hypothetical protein [Novosphingobium sp.]
MATLPHTPDKGDFETAATTKSSTSTRTPKTAPRVRRDKVTSHDSFLNYGNGRWWKIAIVIAVVSFATYFLIDVEPRHNGGSWYGYTMGTIGFALILWLTLLGVRKRAMTPGRWSLKAWTSAHVYLGLSLIVIGTLHTGFQLGWNVHTLAWALMMLVILSGLFGIYVYATLPKALSANRYDEDGAITEKVMIEQMKQLDRQIHDAAQPLDPEAATIVERSLGENVFAGSFWQRARNSYPGDLTRIAMGELRKLRNFRPRTDDDPFERVETLLSKKEALLAKLRRHLQLKSWLQAWLYIHVPATFALIAALSAHVFSVFFYW